MSHFLEYWVNRVQVQTFDNGPDPEPGKKAPDGKTASAQRRKNGMKGRYMANKAQQPAVTKGCLMEVRGAHYPLTGWDQTPPLCDSWKGILLKMCQDLVSISSPDQSDWFLSFSKPIGIGGPSRSLRLQRSRGPSCDYTL